MEGRAIWRNTENNQSGQFIFGFLWSVFEGMLSFYSFVHFTSPILGEIITNSFPSALNSALVASP